MNERDFETNLRSFFPVQHPQFQISPHHLLLFCLSHPLIRMMGLLSIRINSKEKCHEIKGKLKQQTEKKVFSLYFVNLCI